MDRITHNTQAGDNMTPEVKERFEQIRHGNVPEGYKKSLKGIIPKHWEVVRLDSVATGFDYGMNAPAVDYDGANRYIRITDIDEESRKYISEKCVSPGDMRLSSSISVI